MAEGRGFEPPELALNSFQDCRLRPLGHPSASETGVIIARRRENNILRDGAVLHGKNGVRGTLGACFAAERPSQKKRLRRGVCRFFAQLTFGTSQFF